MEPNDGMVNRRHFTMKSTTEQPFESNRTSLTNLKNLEMLRFKPASLNSWSSASEPEVFYRLQVRFREGIVVTGICLLEGGGHQMHHGIGHIVWIPPCKGDIWR